MKSKKKMEKQSVKIKKKPNKKLVKKLGTGLSSLLSKDSELVSTIKSKIESKVGNELRISAPTLSKPQNDKPLKMINLKAKDASTQVSLPIQYLVSGKFQPRKNFDQRELEELAESIKSNGVLQPILVRPLNSSQRSYEIIAGERRWRASQIAKLHEVPVIIRNFTDETALGVAMIENLQRSDLNFIEEAEGYRILMSKFQYTQEKLSQHLGKSRSHIANVLRLLTLPSSVRRQIVEGYISFGHARALVTLNETKAKEVADQIIDKELSVRQTERVVTLIKRQERGIAVHGNVKEQIANDSNANIEYLERELTNLLGLKVVINHKNNKSGNLSIHYKNIDQIQPVIDKLKWRPK